MGATSRMLLAAVVLAVAAASCSSDGGDDETGEGTTMTTQDDLTTTTAPDTPDPRPNGPVADLSTELSGGAGVNVASASPPDAELEDAGYEQHEYAAAGTATAYRPVGELTPDGAWTVEPDREAAYRTRIVVRRPADPADASGTVVVEWLNVSGGLDADPDWQMLREDITRHGDVWVGVSAQVLGIEGGPIRVSTPESEAAGAGRGLRAIDPERYGGLSHPGDDFAYDIYTQVARALTAGGEPLGGATPDLVLAVGESQSAFALVTYLNAVHPMAGVFDGFLVHSRGGPGLPLVNTGGPADIAGSLAAAVPTTLRTDIAEPVLVLQSETDVTGFFASAAVRQDDSDTHRLWEMAGTAHADTRLVGDRASSLGCGAINDGPMHLIAKAAYRSLVTWAGGGDPPPEAPRIELTGGSPPAIARDDDGIALGGIRTPLVDVPVDVLSGAPGPNPDLVCLLSGQTIPLPPESLLVRYQDAADYEARFAAAADDAIAAGFVLEDDREALLARAQPDRIGA